MLTTQAAPAAPGPRNAVWMDAEEVAEAFDVTPRCIYRWEAEGKIPTAVRRGRRWTRWRRSEIDAALAGQNQAKGGRSCS